MHIVQRAHTLQLKILTKSFIQIQEILLYYQVEVGIDFMEEIIEIQIVRLLELKTMKVNNYEFNIKNLI